jgi:MFS transporter, PAT family, beta-lactamase induction signal transducer AmpG
LPFGKLSATSQFALLTSLCASPGNLLAGASGSIKETGFTAFFVDASLIGLPVALLASWVWREQERLSRDMLSEKGPERVAETD